MDTFLSRAFCNSSPVDQWLSHLRQNDVEGDISSMEQEVWPLVDELQSVSGSQHFPLVEENISDIPDVSDYRQFDPFRLETILEEDSDVVQSDCFSASLSSHSNDNEDNEILSDCEHLPCSDEEVGELLLSSRCLVDDRGALSDRCSPSDSMSATGEYERSPVAGTDDACRAPPVGTSPPREKVDDIRRSGVSTAHQRSRTADADKKRAICSCCRRVSAPLSVSAALETCTCQQDINCRSGSEQQSAPVSASCESLNRRIEQLTYDLEEEEERSLQPSHQLQVQQFGRLVRQLVEQYRPCCCCQHSAASVHADKNWDVRIPIASRFCLICSVNFSEFNCDSYINNCVIPLRHFESDSALERIGLHSIMPESESANYRLRRQQSMAQSAENLSEDSGYGDRISPPRGGYRQAQCWGRLPMDGASQRRRQRLWALICRSERRSARVYSDAPCSHAEDPTEAGRHALSRSKSQRSCCADDLFFDSDQEANPACDLVDRPVPAPRKIVQRGVVYQNIPTSSKLIQHMVKSSGAPQPADPVAPPPSKLRRSLSSPLSGARPDFARREQNEDPRAIYLSDEETEVVCFRRSATGRPKPLDLEMAEEFLLLESAENWCPDNVIHETKSTSPVKINENTACCSEKDETDGIVTNIVPSRSVWTDEIFNKLNRSRSMDEISHQHSTIKYLVSTDTQNLPTVEHEQSSQRCVTSSLPNLPSEVASEWLRALSAVGGTLRALSDESAAVMVGSRRACSGRVADASVLAEREWLEASMEPETVEPCGVGLSTVDATAFRRQQVPVKMYGSSENQVQVFIARHAESAGRERSVQRTAGRSVQLSPYVSEVKWRETYDEPEPANGSNVVNNKSHFQPSRISSDSSQTSPGIAANKSPILVSNKRPVLVSKRHHGSVSANTRVLSPSNGCSPAVGSDSCRVSPVPPQRRSSPSIQRVQVGIGSTSPGGGRHVITSERRHDSPQYSVTGAENAAKYRQEHIANNNNNYHSVTNAKPVADKVKHKSFLQKLGFSKGGSKQKAPRVTSAPSSPSSPPSLRFQTEAVSSTPFSIQRIDYPHDDSDKLPHKSVGNGQVSRPSEKHEIDQSFSSNGSVQGTSFSSAECTPRMISRSQKPPLPPQAVQKAQNPSNRMRLHSARRSFLGVNSPATAEPSPGNSEGPAPVPQPASGPSTADADVKQAFERFRDVTRQDRQRLAKSSPDVSAIENVTRSSVRLANVTQVIGGHDQRTVSAPSKRSQEAESAFRAARCRVQSAAVSRPPSRVQGGARLQYRETDLCAVTPADPVSGATAAERARSMVHLPREDHADSSRAKSMEFLLDDANKAATLPPENQLSGGAGRPPSEVQLKFQRSLRNLTVPDWYRRSYRGEAALRRHYSLGASQPGGWSSVQAASRESLSSTWSGQGGLQQRLVVPVRVRLPERQRTASASSSASRASTMTDSTWQRSRPGSLRQPYLGWRSQERLPGGYRTPAERLAGTVSGGGPRAGRDLGESIRQVSSAIVDYFERGPADPSPPRPVWRETSFVGRSPPLPTARRAMSAVPSRADSAVLV